MKISNTIFAVFQLMNEISVKAANDFQKKILVCPNWLPVFFLFSIMNQNWVQKSVLASS